VAAPANAFYLQNEESALAEIAESVRAGQCILFLGAGVHHAPPRAGFVYPAAHRPPMGSALSRALATDSEFERTFPNESVTNLQRVALYYERQRSRSALTSRIRTEVHENRRPSPILRALARMNFPLIITTNYDQLFERALELEQKQARVSVYSPDRFTMTRDYTPAPAQPFLFKIHGDIDHPDSLVITDEDYIQFVMRMTDRDPFNPVPETFVYHLKRWPTLFLGYSLMDYNLRLLFKSLRWKVDNGFPDMYSVDTAPDPLILDIWWNQRRYVRFIVQDVWRFVPKLARLVSGRS
jgi:hypothetical protein